MGLYSGDEDKKTEEEEEEEGVKIKIDTQIAGERVVVGKA